MTLPMDNEQTRGKVFLISRELNKRLRQEERNKVGQATRDIRALCGELELWISQPSLDIPEMLGKLNGIATRARGAAIELDEDAREER